MISKIIHVFIIALVPVTMFGMKRKYDNKGETQNTVKKQNTNNQEINVKKRKNDTNNNVSNKKQDNSQFNSEIIDYKYNQQKKWLEQKQKEKELLENLKKQNENPSFNIVKKE